MPKIKADGHVYDLPAFTLGELRTLKRDFGVEAVDGIRPNDPDHIVGVLFVAIKRERPDVTLEEVEAITRIELVTDDTEVEAVPTEAANDAATGITETTPGSSGVDDQTFSAAGSD